MRKIILDLDTGIDDALALALAVAHEDLELIGVLGTYGNVEVEVGVRNTLALLELLGCDDVPVFVGPQRPGFAVSAASAGIHGANGLGRVELPAPRRQPQPEPAVDFLVRMAHQNRDTGNIVFVPTGPSTTLARALERDPLVASLPVVMMGGALTVPGNVTAWSEANVSQDPAATDVVVRGCRDLTMVGLDVTLQTLLTRATTRAWRAAGTAASVAYADMVDFYIDAYAKNSPHLGGCGLHDPLAVAVAAEPDLVGCRRMPLKVDVDGPTIGRTIGDESRIGEDAGVAVALDVDAERFVDGFVRRLERVLV
ncbi:nucleoside hydrolase [Corynebacterium confusum]|uniref:nucleoside hydrolase n=1 Tax=Corynebacterium confusum TaxID=71254 RepID=UPI0025B52D6D|nr:nucleoside hydrolase [Corynebacterium confusum]WJY89954.1 Pyrimidine-specific ribonucleoside hydrolase RihA [Corynebacterium confusum]